MKKINKKGGVPCGTPLVKEMKIAKFAENQNDILRKNQRKVNILLDYDNENPLMSAFVEGRKWYLIKRIHIRCQKGYIPSPESIRMDDGKYPIYVETTKDSLNIIGDADYIEWSGKQNPFLQNIKKGVEDIIFEDVSLSRGLIECMFYRDEFIKSV